VVAQEATPAVTDTAREPAEAASPVTPDVGSSPSVPNGGELGTPPTVPALVAPAAPALVAEVVTPAPVEWERQLDPRSMKDAMVLANNMHASRMFAAYGTPQAVLATVMAGRELGIPAMGALRAFHIIEGKQSMAAATMVAIVLKSGLAEYFTPVTISDTEVTYTTHRKGAPNPITLTHTFEMAKKAWPKKANDWEKAFEASGWGRNPTDMLVARCTARLARMIYPDLLAGLYTPEELQEIRGIGSESVAA